MSGNGRHAAKRDTKDKKGSPEKSLLRRLGNPIPQRLKIFLMQRYSPEVLIKSNGFAQAQFCFLYALLYSRIPPELNHTDLPARHRIS